MFLVADDAELLFMYLFPLLSHLWGNICSCFLPYLLIGFSPKFWSFEILQVWGYFKKFLGKYNETAFFWCKCFWNSCDFFHDVHFPLTLGSAFLHGRPWLAKRAASLVPFPWGLTSSENVPCFIEARFTKWSLWAPFMVSSQSTLKMLFYFPKFCHFTFHVQMANPFPGEFY